MSSLSRRKFIATGLAGAGIGALPNFTGEANAAVMIRYNVASANGQAMLAKYAKAVGIMMALPPNNPLSWTFQWYTHAVPTNTTKAAALNTVFGPNPSPQKTLATQAWDTCQSHFGAAGVPFFLPWHRMYVCFLEGIIRRVLNDKSFTLPYWNYSVPAGYPMPSRFRMPNDPVYGPLFRPNRRSQSNAGQPIFNGMGVASDLSPANALAQVNYLPVGPSQGFNNTLNQGLHGNVHVFVGNGQGMGSVPWAANDPIFWMHHCNIDRLWASWNAAGHSNPTTAAWQNKTFVFAGPNGQAVTALVKDYTNTVKCNYRYDQLTPALIAVAGGAIASDAAAPPAAPVTLAAPAETGPIALGADPVRVNLRIAAGQAPPADAAGGPTPLLAARLTSLSGPRRLYLVINNTIAAAQPEAIYRIYLDLPEGKIDDPLNSHYVGTFNFFDSVPHGEDHAGHGSRPLSFDITAVVANLQSRGLLKPEPSVTIVPSGQPAADAKPVVAGISFVER